MLEPDVREEDDARAQDVRRVEPPAEPRLDDGDVDPRLGECRESRRRDDLELRRLQTLRGRPNALHRRLEVGLGTVDAGSARSSSRRAARSSSPTESPSERSSCSIVTVAVDLPFVPTTWMAG